MKEQDILFNKTSIYNGRNGLCYLIGLHIVDYNTADNIINLYPINTKGTGYSTKFCIPKEHLQEFINKLQTFL